MARISLLFSLAVGLALGSLFLSVSSHASPGLPRKSPCPKTVSELQTLPFTEIIEYLNQKERFAPKTAEFKEMFSMCKGYVAYLESLYKYENPTVDVLGIAKAKYALMNKAIIEAQASVTGRVSKKTSMNLRHINTEFAKGVLRIKDTIVDISAKHHYKADAKINAQELKTLENAITNFKVWINTFIDMVENTEKKKKMRKLGRHARSLEESQNGVDWFLNHFDGYLGGRSHGRELNEDKYEAQSHIGPGIKGIEAIYGRVSKFIDGYLGGRGGTPPGRQLTEAQTGVNSKSHTGGKVKGSSGNAYADFFRHFGLIFGGKAYNGRNLAEVNADGYVKARFDAAGKMKVAGENGFRSLNKAHYKHFASTEA